MSAHLDLVTSKASQYGIELSLLKAFIQVESAWNPKAFRFEPNYKWFNEPALFAGKLGLTVESEKNAQMTSWGLIQIMGSTARDMGFQGYLPELIDPEIGLDCGCKFLKHLKKKYTRKTDIISAYNAGSVVRMIDGSYKNQDYVSKVVYWLRAFGGQL